MLRQGEFSNLASEVSIRYNHFLELLLAAYNRTILKADLSQRALVAFQSDTNNMLKQFLEREVDNMVGMYNTLREMVNEDTKGLQVDVLEDTDWTDHVSANANFTYEALKLQAAKDVLYVNNYLRSKFIGLHSSNDYQAAFGLISNHKDLHFYYTDKLGRKINSLKYVRTLVRDFFVKNYNDLIAGAAILNNIKEATIDNSDNNHKDTGKIVAINNPDSLNYFSIRDEIFHPNSNSILRLS